MPSWDPKQYNKFENERLRPAFDLINRISLDDPAIIFDLGCGTGKITKVLKQNWPKAKITAVDSSNEMLDQARNISTKITWVLADLDIWEPAENADLIFSNAVLHWLDNHDKLLLRLVSYLKPGGVLAIQVPNNFSAATHVAIRQIATEGTWKTKLDSHIRSQPIESISNYYGYLAHLTDYLDIWETDYLHILQGDNPVLEWIKGSAVRPLTDLLDDKDKDLFLQKLGLKLNALYPKLDTGETLMMYKRLFIICQKKK